MSVEIREVKTKRDFVKFVKFPLRMYRHHPQYVPDLYIDSIANLDADKNPMGKYSKFTKFLAFKDGKVVGRVAAIINEIANESWNHKQVRFGWIDFIDDKEVSRALIEAVIDFGKKYGMTEIAGPLGFTDLDNEGVVVEGFDVISSFMLKTNFPYYKDHFEALGMTKEVDWLEFKIYVPDEMPERFTRANKIIMERYNLHIRKITKREVRKENYGQKIFDLINIAYKDLYDYTKLPQEVIDNYIKTYLGLLDLNYVVLVENEKDELVGVGVTMPSLSHAVQKTHGYLFPFGWWHIVKSMYIKHEDALELLLIAAHPDYKNKGISALIMSEIHPRVKKGGFKWADSNGELESNASMQNAWNLFEKELVRRRRVYGMKIE